MIAEDAIAAVERHRNVDRVCLVGSRAAGSANAFSDWDFRVDTNDFASVARDIESLSAPLRPLAQQWDRLSSTWCWMIMLQGPVKLDFIFDAPHECEPPWEPSAGNLDAIDRHFWDWVLWLAAKQAGNKHDLVRDELHKLSIHLLSPLGTRAAPLTLTEAVESYMVARDHAERYFGASVPRNLEHQVRPLIAK
jgi:hypothetical protein